MRRLAALVALSAIGFTAGACRSVSGLPPRLRACDGPVRATEEIAGDFTRTLRLRVRGGGVDESFGVVLQKRGARLVVLGTNAFGAKAFAVTQQGARFEAQSFLGPALSVPPENVLRDLHRAFFLTPEQAAASERSVTAEPDGALRVVSAACGYETLWVPVPAEGARGVDGPAQAVAQSTRGARTVGLSSRQTTSPASVRRGAARSRA